MSKVKDAGVGQASETLKSQVKEFQTKISEEARIAVNEKMPKKLLALGELLKTHPLLTLSLREVRQNSGHLTTTPATTPSVDERETKKRKLDNSGESERKKRKLESITASASSEVEERTETEIPTNKTIVQLAEMLKLELLDGIQIINTVKIWIQLQIPRIEDGNNFGVGIQEETVNELSRAEEGCFTVLESMTKYFVTRGKLVAKVLKYPGVADYRQSILELDEKEYINLRLACIDLRNNFAILYDMITKNLDKIISPRSNNMQAMF